MIFQYQAMELLCSGQLIDVAFIVTVLDLDLDLKAIGQLLTQGSLSTST